MVYSGFRQSGISFYRRCRRWAERCDHRKIPPRLSRLCGLPSVALPDRIFAAAAVLGLVAGFGAGSLGKEPIFSESGESAINLLVLVFVVGMIIERFVATRRRSHTLKKTENTGDGQMPRWVAIFRDRPEMGQVRRDYAQAHLDYLDAHKDRILIAGGLRPGPGEWPNGGLWVLEAESREEVTRLCEDDPYFRLGLRASYEIHVWGKAFAERSVVL